VETDLAFRSTATVSAALMMEVYRCPICQMHHRVGFDFKRDAKTDEVQWVWYQAPANAVIVEGDVRARGQSNDG
jgi:hypothetical protein